MTSIRPHDDIATSSHADWMSKLPATLHDKPLTNLALPGSHNSGTAYLDIDAPLGPAADSGLQCVPKRIIYNWALNQNAGWDTQLEAGIRYLDLRLFIREDTGELYLVHSMYCDTLRHCLENVAAFLKDHPKEVVLIYFQHFYGLDDSTHALCSNLIEEILGGRLCPVTDTNNVTLSKLWQKNQQVLVFYKNNETTKDKDFLWPKQYHDWDTPGYHTGTDDLLSHLDERYNNERDSQVFQVTSGALSPSGCFIFWHACSTLKRVLADKAGPVFVNWLSDKKAGPQGINVFSLDFVTEYNYIPAVLALNYK